MPRAIQFDPTASFSTQNIDSTTSYTYAYFSFDTNLNETLHGRSTTTAGSPSVSTTTKKFGAGSAALHSSYIKINNSQNAAAFAGEFTIQFFIYFNSLSGNYVGPIGAHYNGGWLMQIKNNQSRFYINGSNQILSSTPPSTGQWVHIAVTRDSSNVVRFFLDGSLLGSITYTAALPTNNDIYIGASNQTGQNVSGYMDDVLIADGICLYTGAFTPPTTASGGSVPTTVTDTRSYTSVFDLRTQYKERAAGNWPT